MASARGILADVDSSRGRAVAVRYDITDQSDRERVPVGAIDAKLTNRCLVAKLGTEARAGPPAALGGRFQWKDENGLEQFPGWPKAGIDNEPTYEWSSHQPGTIDT